MLYETLSIIDVSEQNTRPQTKERKTILLVNNLMIRVCCYVFVFGI